MTTNLRLDTGDKIFHAAHPRVPGYRFEWHPKVKKVYFIRMGVVPEFGQPLGDASNEAQARSAIGAFVRGWLEHAGTGAFAIKQPVKHGDATLNEKTGVWEI